LNDLLTGRVGLASMTKIANIGPQERRKRMLFGAGFLVIGLLSAATLIAGGVPRGWRLLLVVPFWAAGLGLFQARERT
jgi:hypothetical protein